VVGCALAVACAGAVAASSAAAALPEVGRCEAVEKVQEGKKAHYHGAYLNRGCTKPSPEAKGRYEWVSGVGSKDTFAAEATDSPTFTTVEGNTVECQFGAFNGGEYTGPKTEKFSSVELDDCITQAGKVCNTSPREAGVIKDLTPIEGELGVIAGGGGSDPTVGWDLKGVLFAFVCGLEPKTGELGEELAIEGSVIGVVRKGAASDLNHMSEGTQIEYKQSAGKQLPEAFEGGAADTLTTTRLLGTVKSTEATALSGRQINKYEEPLEIRSEA
jgi:hypothetical protein